MKKECAYSECTKCFPTMHPIDETINLKKEVEYEVWETVNTSYQKDGIKKKTKKVVKNRKQMTLEDMIYKVHNEAKGHLGKHLYNIAHQFLAMREIKRNLGEKDLLIHIDFAENYNCKLSAEIQAMHFGVSQVQVTLHNGVAYTKDETISFSTISNSHRHDAAAVWYPK